MSFTRVFANLYANQAIEANRTTQEMEDLTNPENKIDEDIASILILQDAIKLFQQKDLETPDETAQRIYEITLAAYRYTYPFLNENKKPFYMTTGILLEIKGGAKSFPVLPNSSVEKETIVSIHDFQRWQSEFTAQLLDNTNNDQAKIEDISKRLGILADSIIIEAEIIE